MEILSESRNELLKRTEVLASLESKGNPGIAGVAKLVAEKFKAAENQVAVKTVEGQFGTGMFLINAFVYDSEDIKNKTEPKKKEKKAPGQ
jgi:ribosomal protein S24E